MIIVSIIVAIVVGFLIGKFVSGKKEETAAATSDAPSTVPVSDNSDKLERQIADVKEQLASSEQKAKDIKSKYEALLKEANDKIKELDEQLGSALNGNIDESVKSKLDEIANLKKKIKSLEDENEEFEDDLDSCKKKLKNKEEAFSNLEIEFDKLTKVNKKVWDDLNEISEKLKIKEDELRTKGESLEFVQEVLTAKKVSDASVKQLESKVEGLKEFICNDLKDMLCGKSGLNLTFDDKGRDELFYSGPNSWAINAKKSWIQGKTSIAFVGEFSAGKTSIVNRILSQDDKTIPLLPVSTKATTAIPTYISGGVGTMYQFVTPSDELKSISENTFKKVSKEVLDQVKGVSSLIQYFVMTYKNPNLDRLSILDTPGFNSNDKEDAERTIGVINECDALFWVFDVNAGTVNRASINLIKEHLKKPLYVVINKVDTKAASEVDKVEGLIRKTLADAGLTVNGYIRFSAKAPLADIMTPIKTVRHDDSKENYINVLVSLLEKIVKQQEGVARNAKKNADALYSRCSGITAKYDRAVRKMANDCEDVASIPQYNPQHGFLNFKDPNYDMPIDEYNRMCGLLELIGGDNLSSLCDLYNEMSEMSAKLESAWTESSDQKQKWQQLNGCLEFIKKKVKELK
jgi:predicted  nucleic acid-binding Zn-ribbon protein/GTPase SAR1 family protein